MQLVVLWGFELRPVAVKVLESDQEDRLGTVLPPLRDAGELRGTVNLEIDGLERRTDLTCSASQRRASRSWRAQQPKSGIIHPSGVNRNAWCASARR